MPGVFVVFAIFGCTAVVCASVTGIQLLLEIARDVRDLRNAKLDEKLETVNMKKNLIQLYLAWMLCSIGVCVIAWICGLI